jgi:hypothetical protein
VFELHFIDKTRSKIISVHSFRDSTGKSNPTTGQQYFQNAFGKPLDIIHVSQIGLGERVRFVFSGAPARVDMTLNAPNTRAL